MNLLSFTLFLLATFGFIIGMAFEEPVHHLLVTALYISGLLTAILVQMWANGEQEKRRYREKLKQRKAEAKRRHLQRNT